MRGSNEKQWFCSSIICKQQAYSNVFKTLYATKFVWE